MNLTVLSKQIANLKRERRKHKQAWDDMSNPDHVRKEHRLKFREISQRIHDFEREYALIQRVEKLESQVAQLLENQNDS